MQYCGTASAARLRDTATSTSVELPPSIYSQFVASATAAPGVSTAPEPAPAPAPDAAAARVDWVTLGDRDTVPAASPASDRGHVRRAVGQRKRDAGARSGSVDGSTDSSDGDVTEPVTLREPGDLVRLLRDGERAHARARRSAGRGARGGDASTVGRGGPVSEVGYEADDEPSVAAPSRPRCVCLGRRVERACASMTLRPSVPPCASPKLLYRRPVSSGSSFSGDDSEDSAANLCVAPQASAVYLCPGSPVVPLPCHTVPPLADPRLGQTTRRHACLRYQPTPSWCHQTQRSLR